MKEAEKMESKESRLKTGGDLAEEIIEILKNSYPFYIRIPKKVIACVDRGYEGLARRILEILD